MDTTRFGATIVVEYTYDADGNRVRKTIDGTVVINYLVDTNRDDAQVLEERDGSGNLLARYVYGHGLISQTIDGAHHFYHYDGFHHTRALSDMNGAVTDTYRYDAYGTVLHQTGVTKNPYLYRGEQFDAETNAYYLRARYYQPDTGRFTSVDPLEGNPSEPMTLHRYAYGNNDPVTNLDPSGKITLAEVQVNAGIVGIISGISAGGWALGNVLPNQYAWLAENIFPDAGIIGGSFFVKSRMVKPKFFWWTKNISPFLKLPLNFFDTPYNIVNNGWWQEDFNAGITVGAEALWSFGSSQRGLFWYVGPQIETGYAQGLNTNRVSVDFTLYTGYVFNLWNCDDYLGAFAAFNTPIGSYFFDPEDVVENRGPWGPSWPIWSKSFRSASSNSFMAGAGGTWYIRRPFGDPSNVPYGQLAIEWTAIQSGITVSMALRQNNISAIVTGVSASFTGMIARSKQIYNKRHDFYPDDKGDALYERQNRDRPSKWRSGPTQPYSKLLGLFL